MALSLKIADKEEAFRSVLSGEVDVSLYKEDGDGITFFYINSEKEFLIPKSVQILPSFRKIGEPETARGEKASLFRVYRTVSELMEAFSQ